MIWAGQGVLYAGVSEQLTALAEYLAAPVMTTLLGKSAFNERHPLALGTGLHSRTTMVTDYIQECDVVFAIDASLTRTIFAPPIPLGKKIIHATVDPNDINKNYSADVPILGDARLVLTQLLTELRSQHGESGRPERADLEANLSSMRARWLQRWTPKLTTDEVPINPYRVIDDLIKTVDPQTTIVTHDSGSPRDEIVPLYEPATPRGYLGWGHSTQLGFSLGAAMGAKLAAPEKLMVTFMGDAAFGMVGIDVETAVREQISILILLVNNSAMGNYQMYIPKATERYGTMYLTDNYCDVARSLGAFAERIEQPAEIIPALERAIEQAREGRPASLEFITRDGRFEEAAVVAGLL